MVAHVPGYQFTAFSRGIATSTYPISDKNIWGDKCNDYTELNRLVSLQEKLLTIEQLKLHQVPKSV
jgi:hypothetical protein